MSAPKIFTVISESPDAKLIEEAARILSKGGLVGFPTETVYGLAADPSNPKAMDRLNEVKGRPPEKQYSIHIYDRVQVKEFVNEIPVIAQALIEKFWPGPLTIIMPGKNGGPVGFRFPSHPVANSIVNTVGAPNTAGNTSKVEGFEYSVANYGTGALTQTANYYPRALISRHKVINNDFIMPVVQTTGATNAATYVMGSVYYGA